MKSFGSDNHSGIHPTILEALAAANHGHAVAYGDDPITARVEGMLRGLFGEKAESYLVFNGTAANMLALGGMVRSFEAVVCPATAHINTDECGAPERQCGCKLIGVETPDGKLTPGLVRPRLKDFGSVHQSQPKVISISQPTELGTLYTAEEIAALAELAHSHGMKLHVDGARLANALAATGLDPMEMITRTGVDALSLGGTKNGLMLGEAVVFPQGAPDNGAPFRRKQLMQLPSKMRFVAAQFEAYLTDDLWLRMAAHSNRMATVLAQGASGIRGVELVQRRQVNAVFARLSAAAIEKLREHYYFYNWDGPEVVRWMTSWDTTQGDVEGFLERLKEAVKI